MKTADNIPAILAKVAALCGRGERPAGFGVMIANDDWMGDPPPSLAIPHDFRVGADPYALAAAFGLGNEPEVVAALALQIREIRERQLTLVPDA